MKLNYDYIREILLYIEENLNYKDTPNSTEHNEILYLKIASNLCIGGRNKNELVYAIEQLIKEEYIECSRKRIDEGNITHAVVIGLTWKGHELLNCIRDEKVWNTVKKKLSKIGTTSLSIMAGSAKNLGLALLTNPNALQDFIDGVGNIMDMF